MTARRPFTLIAAIRLGTLVVALAIGAAGIARADTTPAVDGAGNAAASSERQKLRVELDRVNGEIDALKRQNRGLADDYRLRARMADAEALARRLTELDARAARASGTPVQGPAGATWPAAPQASPSDDRAELEAKADILSDQSRRLSGQADLLNRRVSELRNRQELKRRAGQLERDPFSPLEQAKRRIATSGATASTAKDGRTVLSGDSAGATSSPSVAGTSTGTITPVTSPGAGTSFQPAPASPTVGRANDSTGSSSVASPPTLISPAGVDTGTPIAAQFRGILDAATLAEIKKLELPGSPSGNLQAMERAQAALRVRAAELDARATALRKRAK
jgi:TolA-binding protein